MSSHRWVYSDKRWEPLRSQVFTRDKHKCQHCGKLVMHDVHRNHKHKGIVDHIVPLSKDDTKAFDLDNLQTLHKSCHDGAKKEQDHRGYFIGFDANGMPIDKRHPWNLK